jgi:signal transduction histidine kinase
MRTTLAARLSALALGQLALITLVAMAIAELTRPPAPRDLSETLRDAATDIPARPSVSARALSRIGAAHGFDLTLYAPDETVVSSSVDPPVRHHAPDRDAPDARGGPPGLEAPRDHHPRDGGPPPDGLFSRGGPPDFPHGGPVLAVDLGDGFVLAARPVRPAPLYLGPLLTLLAAALVLGVGGLLTARWIVRPLKTLRGAASAIARGELTVRTGLMRDDELGEVARAFDDMLDRIEQARRAERELLANVSHELRTPLARLRVALELAEEGHASGKAALGDAAVDLGELESIVESILSAMRMEQSGGAEFGLPAGSLRDVAVAELLESARDRFRSRHARPIDLVLDRAVPAVMVDPLLLRRVIDNLLENAHKYSPDPDAPIALTASRASSDTVAIAVVDRGMGIDASDLAQVFQPFFRAEKSRTRRAGGVGLGLTLCKRIVEAHGGTIALTSEPGRGTTATVRLPVRPSSDATDMDGHARDNTG